MEEKYTIESIEILEGGQAIRRRPGLYFDCFEKKSLDSLAFEIACHAFDEYFDGKCTELRLTVWGDACSIWYNAGMSLQLMPYEDFTDLEAMMTVLYACTNLKKHLAVGKKYCHVGMASVNHASEKCLVTTVCEGQKGTFEFADGEIIARNIEPCEPDSTWTEILIQPSTSIFGDLKFTSKGIAERAAEIRDQLKDLDFVVEDRISQP
jgi:DNA gyrase/topoisomerase IV subunit B